MQLKPSGHLPRQVSSQACVVAGGGCIGAAEMGAEQVG